jgi:hypothetical protein
MHRTQKSLGSAKTARQGIQPHESSAFTPRARLRPAGRLCLSGHIDIFPSGLQDIVTEDNTEDSEQRPKSFFHAD